jgi:hypothetical protein
MFSALEMGSKSLAKKIIKQYESQLDAWVLFTIQDVALPKDTRKLLGEMIIKDGLDFDMMKRIYNQERN